MMTEEEIKRFLEADNSEFSDEEKMAQPIVSKLQFPRFKEEAKIDPTKSNYDFIKDVKISINVELGNSEIKVRDLLSWSKGSIIGLNKIAGETINVDINGQHIATGEIIIINDSFGVRISALQEAQNKKGRQ